MELEHMNLLRQEVEKTFGRKILSSADCRYLSAEIASQAHFEVSFNTLRRFFNLMKPTHHPSLFTLNVLATYCGYLSYDNFKTSRQKVNEKAFDNQSDELLNYLIFLFKNAEVNSENDLTYLRLVQQTVIFLEQHTNIVDRFQKEIAKTINGQHYYFEHLVNIDKLNSFYGQGLHFYLQEKKQPEAQIFGHSLLCLRSWLTMNSEGVKKHFKELMRYALDKSLKSSVCGRFFASQLFYADMTGTCLEQICVRAREFYSSIAPVKDCFSLLYSFEMVMAEALILTSQYEEALYYIEEIIIKVRRFTLSFIDERLLETICLYKAIVYTHCGKKARAAEILHEINPYRFCTLSRQYLTILYLTIKNILKDKNCPNEQIQHLAHQTGFNRLLAVWDNSYQLSNKYA